MKNVSFPYINCFQQPTTFFQPFLYYLFTYFSLFMTTRIGITDWDCDRDREREQERQSLHLAGFGNRFFTQFFFCAQLAIQLPLSSLISYIIQVLIILKTHTCFIQQQLDSSIDVPSELGALILQFSFLSLFVTFVWILFVDFILFEIRFVVLVTFLTDINFTFFSPIFITLVKYLNDLAQTQ